MAVLAIIFTIMDLVVYVHWHEDEALHSPTTWIRERYTM